MKVIVTGATGFIGRHLVGCLLARGHAVTAVARHLNRAQSCEWFDSVHFVALDLDAPPDKLKKQLGHADVLVHLAWPGLPNYRDLFHIECNLPNAYRFLRAAIEDGYPRLLVTGTCFEYGMLLGQLSEDVVTNPDNPYGLAKDTLRKQLQALQRVKPFVLQWCRLFYMFGEGQNPKSLLSQLDGAIDRGDESFAMSGGEQLRDYLPVCEVVRRLATLVEHPSADGIFNICSGQPVSVRKLAENHIRARAKSIKLDLGVYPYPDYEPFAFWGNSTKYHQLEGQS